MMVENPIWLLSGKIDKLGVDYLISFARIYRAPTDFLPSKKWEKFRNGANNRSCLQGDSPDPKFEISCELAESGCHQEKFLISIKEKSKAWWSRLPP